LNNPFDNSEALGTHSFHGASYKQFLHYAQVLHTNRFQQWAPYFNTLIPFAEEYEAPLFPLENITDIPIALVVGQTDELIQE
jgi:hypothetical protein